MMYKCKGAFIINLIHKNGQKNNNKAVSFLLICCIIKNDFINPVMTYISVNKEEKRLKIENQQLLFKVSSLKEKLLKAEQANGEQVNIFQNSEPCFGCISNYIILVCTVGSGGGL